MSEPVTNILRHVRTLAEILKDPSALLPPPHLIPGLVWRERATMLSAREKSGKSTLASAAVAALSAGADFLGHALEPGRVLWLALEEHLADTASRLHHFGADPENILLVQALEDPLRDYAVLLDHFRPDLVVVDTLAALISGLARMPDSGASAPWTRVMRSLVDPIRDAGCGLLVLHHGRKRDGAYRDSTAIGAGVDAVLAMTGKDPERTIKGTARWAIADFHVRLAQDQFLLESPAQSTADLATRVLEYVSRHPGCRKGDVRDGVVGRAASVVETVARLLDSGLLEDRGHGRASALHLGTVLPID